MRNLLILCFMVLSLSSASAQDKMYINNKVTIESDFSLNFVMDAHLDKNKNCDVADGFRVQVVNSSNREDVYAKKAEVYTYFTDFKGYIVYDQPYYKLRIGDFVSRMEARRYLDEIITVFPTAFIVSDEIKIK